ncbi:hypothetical protein V8C40DRAFT_259910 [Trichoderma camerunense]
MSHFHIAFTAPVNTVQASPRLTRDDVWQGCVLLAQAPETFTSAIASCQTVLKEGERTVRTLRFRNNALPDIKQEVILVDKFKFECTTLATGNKVTTVIFHGISGDLDDLFLSLEYSIPYGGTDPDSTEGDKFRAQYTEKAKENLMEGLETMRKLKIDGKLY